MTSKIGSAATNKVVQRITGPSGLNAGLAALTQGGPEMGAALDAAQVRVQNVPAEMAERSGGVKYPSVNVYCETIANQLEQRLASLFGGGGERCETRRNHLTCA